MIQARVLLLLCFVLLPGALADRPPKKEKGPPLLWRIEGDKPSHLLGTIELGVDAKKALAPVVWQRLKHSPTFVTDVDLRNVIGQRLTPHLLLPKGRMLDTLLAPATWNRLTRMVGDLSEEDIKRYRPWVLSQMLLPPALTRGTPMRRVLIDTAARARKKLVFLESVLAQVKRASGLPLVKQASALSWEINNRALHKKQLEAQVAAYRAGSLSSLGQRIFDPRRLQRFPEFFEQMYTRPNQQWMARLEPLIKQGHVFIALDSTHLLGQQGLIELLRARGYKVVRIDK